MSTKFLVTTSPHPNHSPVKENKFIVEQCWPSFLSQLIHTMVYMLYDDFDIYPVFTLVKTITLS